MRSLLLVCAAAALLGCASPTAPSATGRFEGRLLVLSDTDMAGSAYADGRLEPIDGLSDTLTLVDPAKGALGGAPAPNSVLSWPQVMATSADGRFAYVVETRGAPPAGAERLKSVQDLPKGGRLTVIRRDGEQLTVAASVSVGDNPQSVDLSPDGRWLAIATESGGGEVVLVELADGLPGRVLKFPLKLDYREGDPERLPRTLDWSPAGDVLALNIALRRIAFLRLTRGPDGAPTGIVRHGPVLDIGKRLSRGVWTSDGRYFLTADINADAGALARLIGAPGVVTAIAYDPSAAAAHRIAGRVEVGGSPEGIALSPDGRRVVTVNLERTFLPENPLVEWLPGRNRYSLDLLAFDPATGTLARLSRIEAGGILPEDAIFDREGQAIAVAVFHRRRGADRRRGFIDFYSVRGDRLAPLGMPIGVPRGVHDLELVP